MEFRFSLTYNSTETFLDNQPDGWKDFQSEVRRDFNWHGAVYKFTSGTLRLGFPGEGRDILETAFQAEGVDAEVIFKADSRDGINPNGAYTNLFTGRAVMKNREYTNDFFRVDFEDSSFQQKVVNRLRVKVDLGDTEDIDGNTMTGGVPEESETWPDIKIKTRYDAGFSANQDSRISLLNETGVLPSLTGSQLIYMQWGYEDVSINTFNKVLQEGGGQSAMTWTTADFFEENGPTPLLVSNKAGSLNITGYLNALPNANATTAVGGNSVSFSYQVNLVHYDSGGNLQSTGQVAAQVVNKATVAGINEAGFNEISTAIDETFTVDAGDFIFLVYDLTISVDIGSFEPAGFFRVYNETAGGTRNTIDAILTPDQIDRDVDFFLIENAMKRITQSISGEDDRFESDFFDSTGCGYLNGIVTGSELRGVENRPRVSMQDCLNWANARYGVGYGFKNTVYGYKLQVEPMDFFYQDVQILDLGPNISEKDTYREEYMDEFDINRVEIGYRKFSTDDVNILNDFSDFLTESEYSLPLSTVQGEYVKISPFICSNELIQATYDKTSEADTESWKYDDDVFLVALKSSGDLTPENDENFDTVSGLSDSGSAYNIRHAPCYMILEHANIINASLFGKSDTVEIKNNSAKVNKDFSARYDASEPCRLGDAQRLTRSATGNIEKGDNDNGNTVWKPVKHFFTAACTSSQLNTIIDSMEGNAGPTDYGYLTYRDDDGNTKDGFLLNLRWNPFDEIGEFETIEKA